MMYFAECVFFISILAIIYHHVGYLVLLRFFSAKHSPLTPPIAAKNHHFVFVIPMYNEAVFIEKKIANLALLNYPKELFDVVLADDGSTDKTVEFAKDAAQKHPQLSIRIIENPDNQGKVALFNQIIPTLNDDCILFFSDVSAMLSTNALERANAFFNIPKMGAFCSRYKLSDKALKGEQRYWDYQVAVRIMESSLGSPIGYHGSGYALRKNLWQPLPPETINDDFIMPMRAIEQGYLGIYDEECISTELELSSEHVDWNRRVRIAQGNIQQVGILYSLLAPQFGYIAWMFFSSKALRITMPWFFIALFITSLVLSLYHPYVFLPILLAQCALYLIAVINSILHLKVLNVFSYFVRGQYSIFVGWLSMFKNQDRWRRAKSMPKSHYVHPVVRCGKWIMDKISALLGLSLMVLLFPFIAVAIKLTSKGPIFYKQLRVGKGDERLTRLFYVYKFRTMGVGSDKANIKWTMPGDSRIFPVGKFLRKTHIDELPQFYNILIGDMSLIGPRPEKPSLYSYIEHNIPFYEERLYGILPGLTGLAQVTFPPDVTIDDVKKKVACDHAYAIQLTKPLLWIKVESIIVLKTIQNVMLGKGQ